MKEFLTKLGRQNHLACALLGGVVVVGSCRSHESKGLQPSASSRPAAPRAEPAPGDENDPSARRDALAANPPAAKDGSAPKDDASQRNDEPPTKKKYVVAALGDSITDAEVGGGGYLRYLEKKCPQSVFDHFGKGGDMTNQMRRRFEKEVLPQIRERGYTTLIVYGGVNDLYSNETAGRTNDRIEQDLSQIYERAKDAGLEVVAVTVSPWGGFSRYFNQERSQNTQLLNSWILGGPAKGRVDRAVDSYPILSCGDPEVLCPEYETRSHDGLHPGSKGHEILGQALYEKAFSDCL